MNANCYRIKSEYANNFYPWPCDSDKDRTIQIFDDDVMTKSPNGKYTMHTGICKLNIIIPDDHLTLWEKEPKLVMTDLAGYITRK